MGDLNKEKLRVREEVSRRGLLSVLNPALARLALEPEMGSPNGWYLPQLLFHLNYEGKSNHHLIAASMQQRDAVTQFLIHIKDTRPELIHLYSVEEELEFTIDIWANN